MATEKQNPEVQEEEVKTETTPKKEKKKRSDKKNEIEALANELAALKDAHLRTLAEYDNYRKRSQREKEATYADAKANTLKTLLPVLDNFDRAADNKTDDIEVYRKGIEMTLAQLGSILEGLEVEAFGEVGDEFDPNIHSAVMTVENPDLPENSIAGVFEKGYRMGDRILRFATVQVTN
ncbi:MAG: nucleotide exchange factor GrpE [Clostridia bacterium]|nr:nucleotide exchange factor GrpE [Clostridia bacterium]